MDFSTVIEFLDHFRTDQVVSYLGSIDIGELVTDPRFLVGMGLFSIIALIMRWRILLATILTLAGFSGLIAYTVRQETSLTSLSSDTLLLFVGGGVGIIFVVLYLLFVKTE